MYTQPLPKNEANAETYSNLQNEDIRYMYIHEVKLSFIDNVCIVFNFLETRIVLHNH